MVYYNCFVNKQCFPSIALQIGPFRCIPGRVDHFLYKNFEGEKELHKQGALREFGHYAAMNILGMIGISCYILADTFFVAQGTGSLGLAALNIAIPAYNLMNGIGLMLGVGAATQYMIARAQNDQRQADSVFTHAAALGLLLGVLFLLGGLCFAQPIARLLGVGAATQYMIARAQNDQRQADSVFTHAAALGLLLGVLFLLGGLCFAQPIARLLGADAQTLGMTTTYLRMLWCFGPFFVMNNVLLAFTRNDGAPTVAMCGMIAGSLFNIVFDYIFIFPCGLGMFGAALATGFSPFVSILVLLTHLRRPSRGFHLVNTPLRVSRVPSLCAPGLSSLIGEIASGVVLLLFNLVLLRLSGNTGVAAYGVVANLALVGIAVFTGLCTGIQPLVSRSSGLGDREQLRRLFRWGICTALGIAAVLCVSVFLGAEPLTAVFNSEHDPQLAAYAESGLRIYFTGFLFAGVNMVTAAFFSASDKTVQGFAISLLRGVIAVPPILFPLAWALGVDGVWLTFPMVELVTAVAALVWARKYIIEN